MTVVNPFRFIEFFFLFLFLFLLGFAAFFVGPPVERAFFPVLDAKITMVEEVDNNRLRFYVEGRKLRGCQLDAAAFAWKLDRVIMPAAVSDENGLPRPASAIVQSGDTFIAGPFYALIPTAVRLANNLHLTRTYYYRCHFAWLTEYDIEQPLDLVTVTSPSAPAQSPTVRILPK